MRLPEHVFWDRSRLAFRRRWPQHVVAVAKELGLGSQFKRSLGTSDPREASKRYPELLAQFNREVERLEAKLPERSKRELTEVEARLLVARWFTERHQENEEEHLQSPAETYDENVLNAEWSAKDLRRRIGRNDIGDYAPLARNIAAEHGVAYDEGSPAWRTLLQLLVRANKELTDIDLSRMAGEFGKSPADPFFRDALAAGPAEKPRRTVADLITAYRAEKGANWAPKTRVQYEHVFRAIEESFGKNRDIASIDRQACEAVRAMLQELPPNATKLAEFKGLSIPKAAEKAKAKRAAGEALPRLLPKSLNLYLGYLSSVFRWAEQRTWIAQNPASVARQPT